MNTLVPFSNCNDEMERGPEGKEEGYRLKEEG